VGVEKRGERLGFGVRIFEFVLLFFSWGIHKYIALLESEKKEVMKRFGWKQEKIVVIPNGIQEVFYTQGGEAQDFYKKWDIEPEKWDLIVGTVSRLNYVKGIQNLEFAANKLIILF